VNWLTRAVGFATRRPRQRWLCTASCDLAASLDPAGSPAKRGRGESWGQGRAASIGTDLPRRLPAGAGEITAPLAIKASYAKGVIIVFAVRLLAPSARLIPSDNGSDGITYIHFRGVELSIWGKPSHMARIGGTP